MNEFGATRFDFKSSGGQGGSKQQSNECRHQNKESWPGVVAGLPLINTQITWPNSLTAGLVSHTTRTNSTWPNKYTDTQSIAVPLIKLNFRWNWTITLYLPWPVRVVNNNLPFLISNSRAQAMVCKPFWLRLINNDSHPTGHQTPIKIFCDHNLLHGWLDWPASLSSLWWGAEENWTRLANRQTDSETESDKDRVVTGVN